MNAIFRILLLCALMMVMGCRNDTDARFKIGRAAVQHDLGVLEEALSSDNDDLRCYAATAISRIRNQKALPLYLSILEMDDCGWKIPAEAAFRIEEINARTAAPNVMLLLSSSDVRLQVNASIALAGLGWTDAAPQLHSLVETSDDPLAKAWFAWAICSLNQSKEGTTTKTSESSSLCVRPNKRSNRE